MHAPDLCQSRTRAELHALAESCSAKFDRLAIDDIRTQTLFCMTALQLGPTFDAQLGWPEALARVAKKQVSFDAVLKEMGV